MSDAPERLRQISATFQGDGQKMSVTLETKHATNAELIALMFALMRRFADDETCPHQEFCAFCLSNTEFKVQFYGSKR